MAKNKFKIKKINKTVIFFILIGLITAVVIGIRLITNSSPKCLVTGCNGEICQGKNEEPVISICLWKEEYTCYKTAKCEVQQNRKCGWTQTSELTDCLQKSR